MKFLISIFFMAGSLAMIQMLDNALTSKNPRKLRELQEIQQQTKIEKITDEHSEGLATPKHISQL